MKIVFSCLLCMFLFATAYLYFNQSAGQDVHPEAIDTQMAIAAVAEKKPSPVQVISPQKTQSGISTIKASLASERDSNKQSEYSIELNNAFDNLQTQINNLYEPVDIETMDYEDCQHLSGQVFALWRDSELFDIQGTYMLWSEDKYEDYWHFETDFLRQLAEADDFVAQQMLSVILMNSVDTLEEGLRWAKIAIARDSTASIKRAQMAYRQMFSKTHEANYQLKASEIELQFEVFEALSQYRDGSPIFRQKDKEQYLDDPVAQEYFALLDEILTLRESYGLPQFVNRPQPGPPEKIRRKCKDLFLEQVRQINPAAFQDN